MSENKLVGQKTALEEMKLVLAKQFESVEILKGIAKTILASASLVFALGNFINFKDAFNNFSLSAIALLLIISTLFVGMVWFCVSAIFPVILMLPTKAKWETLDDNFFNKTEEEVCLQLISNYLQAIDLNAPVIASLQDKVNTAGIVFGLIAFFTLLGCAF